MTPPPSLFSWYLVDFKTAVLTLSVYMSLNSHCCSSPLWTTQTPPLSDPTLKCRFVYVRVAPLRVQSLPRVEMSPPGHESGLFRNDSAVVFQLVSDQLSCLLTDLVAGRRARFISRWSCSQIDQLVGGIKIETFKYLTVQTCISLQFFDATNDLVW